MLHDRLIGMANQIATFFAHEPHDKAVDDILDHIVKFWDPSMRKKIVAQYGEDAPKMHPLAREAIAKLAETMQPASGS